MIWPYAVAILVVRFILIYLQALSAPIVITKGLELMIIVCLMALEYKIIDKYVKIKFFENKKRLKILIVCQFVLFEIINIFSVYFVEHGMTIG